MPVRLGIFHKFLEQLVEPVRLIEEDGVRGVLDLLKARIIPRAATHSIPDL